jgi:hypothetical protein
MSGTIAADRLIQRKTIMNHNRFIAVLCLLLIAVSAQAQSGRRQVKPPPAAPVPTPTPEATPVAKKETEPEMVLLVASDRNSGALAIPFTYYSAAQRGCADRLKARSSAGIDVDVAERDMSRGEAIKKAKSEKRTYVILLTLAFDSMSNRYDDLQLDFLLLEPTTAKVIITGRSYMNSNRKGGLIVSPTGRVPALYREQLLREAGEDAADRILKKLKLATLPR